MIKNITENKPMTQEEAEKLTGLTAQHMPDASNRFLHCKLGKTVHSPKVFKIQRGGTEVERSVIATVFHVAGYGATWDAAALMALRARKRKAK